MCTSSLSKPRTRSIAVWKLNEMIDDGEVFAEAPYQRDIVWNMDKMAGLIDSILNNYYIPPLLFAVRRSADGNIKRIVIDGKQRLAACRRFMKNIVPFVDTSSGTTVQRYYLDDESVTENDTDYERKLRLKMSPPTAFLTQEQFDIFNEKEFVVVEYTDISEEDEFNLFSRVQLGVSLSAADKLKATHSPLAEAGRRLTAEFQQLTNILHKKNDSELFRLIVLSYYSLAVDPEFFRPYTLQKFLASENNPPNDELLQKIRRALGIMKTIAANDERVFRSYHGSTVLFKTVEFLTFIKFVTLVSRPRPVADFVNDFRNFRDYFYNERSDSKFYLNTRLWQEIVEWLQNYAQEKISPSQPPPVTELIQPHTIDPRSIPPNTAPRQLNQPTIAAQPDQYRSTSNDRRRRQRARRTDSTDQSQRPSQHLPTNNNIPTVSVNPTPQVIYKGYFDADQLTHEIFNDDDDLSDEDDVLRTGTSSSAATTNSTVPFKRRNLGRSTARRGAKFPAPSTRNF